MDDPFTMKDLWVLLTGYCAGIVTYVIWLIVKDSA
jgi:hypothetical protein